jgi:hypothetical protein
MPVRKPASTDIQTNPVAALSEFGKLAIADHSRAAEVINQRIGGLRVQRAVSKMLTVMDLMELNSIKEAKSYKGFVFVAETGDQITINTWEDYCRLVEGASRNKIDDDILNLQTHGEEMFEAMREVGLGPSKMRALRKIPENEKEQLKLLANTGDKDALLELTEDIIARNAKEKAELKAKLEESTADNAAKEELLASKDKKLNDMAAKLRHLKDVPPDEQHEAIRQEAGQACFSAEAQIRGAMFKALEAVQDHATVNNILADSWLQGQVNQVEDALEELRTALSITRAVEDELVPWSKYEDEDSAGESSIFEAEGDK